MKRNQNGLIALSLVCLGLAACAKEQAPASVVVAQDAATPVAAPEAEISKTETPVDATEARSLMQSVESIKVVQLKKNDCSVQKSAALGLYTYSEKAACYGLLFSGVKLTSSPVASNYLLITSWNEKEAAQYVSGYTELFSTKAPLSYGLTDAAALPLANFAADQSDMTTLVQVVDFIEQVAEVPAEIEVATTESSTEQN